MGWSTHHSTGLIHYAPQHSYRGYTLVTGSGGHHAENTNAGLTGGAHNRTDDKRLYPALHLVFPPKERGYVTD